MDDAIRAHVIVIGRVQGVCFRMETQSAANRYGVTGWVKNNWDATVEAVFEGKKEDVASIVAWCRKGPPGSIVKKLELEYEEYTGKEKGFRITY